MARTAKTRKKIIFAVLIFAVLLFLVFPAQVINAQNPGPGGGPPPAPAPATGNETPSLWECIKNPVTCGIAYAVLLIRSVIKILVGLAAWMVDLALTFNRNLIGSPVVTAGFGVSLSLANLGFVFGIIIIAIATILRWQTYGMKQLLWKLIIAALVVNFSLVIAGEILGFSDNLSQYFLDRFGWGSNDRFVNALTAGFNPQSFSAPASPADYGACAAQVTNSYLVHRDTARYRAEEQACQIKATTANTGSVFENFDNFMKFILNVVFAILFLFIILLTLAALAVMLLIRYVYIGILLILAPLAWLMWIFPNFKHLWTKWWNLFIRWAFFPPLVLFFLGLAITVMSRANNSYFADSVQTLSTMNSIAGTIEGSFLGNVPQQIILLALAIGGLFAANSLGIHGASFAMGVAKGAGNWAKGVAWRGTKAAATRPLRGEWGRSAAGAMETAGMQYGQKGGAIRRTIGKGIRGLLRPVREAGVGMAKLRAPTEKEVSLKKREFSKLSLQEQARMFGTENGAGRRAIMENLKDAQGSNNRVVKSAATKALNGLPADMKDKFDKLGLLYGRGKPTGKMATGRGKYEETFAGESARDKFEEAKIKLRKEIEKDGEGGKDVGHKKEILEALEAMDEKSEENKKSAWEDLKTKVGDAIEKERAAGGNTRTLEDLESAIRDQTKEFSEIGEKIKEAVGETKEAAGKTGEATVGGVFIINGRRVRFDAEGREVLADDEK